MMSKERRDLKRETLQKFGTLYTAANAVSDELFLAHAFFDPRDLVQVKYEMLRRVRVEGQSVSQAARDFGFSRTAFYQAQSLLAQQGLPGLIPKRPGPKGGHKLNEDVLAFIQRQQQETDETLRPEALAKLILDTFGFSIHPRSIERALSRQQKKGG